LELSYLDRDSHRANPRRDRETARGDQIEDSGDPRTSGTEDAEVTHDEYIEQLEAISEAGLPATQTMECQIAFSFIEYLQRFENYETRTAQGLILDILKKNNVRIVRDIPIQEGHPLIWSNAMFEEIKRRQLLAESRQAQ
jgi:hypothetical protein